MKTILCLVVLFVSVYNKENLVSTNIHPPFNYKKLNINFFYDNMRTHYYLSHDTRTLRVVGDFGYLKYNDDYYFSTELNFFSPSKHTFKNKNFPLELNIVHRNMHNSKITVVILFEKSSTDFNTLLEKLDFKSEMKNLSPNKQILVKKNINLSKYIDDSKSFFFYDDGADKYVILSDILNVNENQIENFPEKIRNDFRKNKNKVEFNINVPMNELQSKVNQNQKIIEENQENSKDFEKLSKIESKNQKENLQNDEDEQQLHEGKDVIDFNEIQEKNDEMLRNFKGVDVKIIKGDDEETNIILTGEQNNDEKQNKQQEQLQETKENNFENNIQINDLLKEAATDLSGLKKTITNKLTNYLKKKEKKDKQAYDSFKFPIISIRKKNENVEKMNINQIADLYNERKINKHK